MVGPLQTRLRGVAADPECHLSELPLLTEVEDKEVVVSWNATRREYAREKTVVELFREQARLRPEAEAVRFEGRSLTYRELDARSSQLARHLRRLGVGPEGRVGI